MWNFTAWLIPDSRLKQTHGRSSVLGFPHNIRLQTTQWCFNSVPSTVRLSHTDTTLPPRAAVGEMGMNVKKHTHWQIISYSSSVERYWCGAMLFNTQNRILHSANECLTMTLDKGCCWNQWAWENERWCTQLMGLAEGLGRSYSCESNAVFPSMQLLPTCQSFILTVYENERWFLW